MSIKLRVGGVPEHFNAPWHIAKKRDLFSDIGVDVEWTDYPGGTGAMAKALNENETDVAVILTEGIVKDIATGGKSKIVATYVKSPLCWGVHTGSGQADINSLNDLEGKVWAVSRMGSGSHLMAVVLAESLGWDTSTLKYEIVNNLDGAKASLTLEMPELRAPWSLSQTLLAGTSKGFLWEKFTTKPHVDSGVLKRIGEIPTPWPCFVVAVRTDVLEKHGGKVKDLLGVLAKVCSEFKAAADSVAYIAAEYKLKPEDAAEWFSTVEWSCSTAMPSDVLEQVGSTLKALGQLDEKPEPKDLWWST